MRLKEQSQTKAFRSLMIGFQIVMTIRQGRHAVGSGELHESGERHGTELGSAPQGNPLFPKKFQRDEASRFPRNVLGIELSGQVCREFNAYSRHDLTLARISGLGKSDRTTGPPITLH
jgi:hypothetical protein